MKFRVDGNAHGEVHIDGNSVGNSIHSVELFANVRRPPAMVTIRANNGAVTTEKSDDFDFEGEAEVVILFANKRYRVIEEYRALAV